MVLTTSVLMPVIEAAKIDPLWFGIYMVVVVWPISHPAFESARNA